MKNLLGRLVLGTCLLASKVFGRELYDNCEPNDPTTCDMIEKGGCCMVWEAMYHSSNNFLYVEVGREYKQCVNKEIMDFIFTK